MSIMKLQLLLVPNSKKYYIRVLNLNVNNIVYLKSKAFYDLTIGDMQRSCRMHDFF